MSSITGLDGLLPTLKIIKHTNKIAIANKESIICGWNLLSNELKKRKTEFIPVDSEHFSIWFGLINSNALIDKYVFNSIRGAFLQSST
jgi:1-deoxy-D-xylulose-5-phosphate reductoisomerase